MNTRDNDPGAYSRSVPGPQYVAYRIVDHRTFGPFPSYADAKAFTVNHWLSGNWAILELETP